MNWSVTSALHAPHRLNGVNGAKDWFAKDGAGGNKEVSVWVSLVELWANHWGAFGETVVCASKRVFTTPVSACVRELIRVVDNARHESRVAKSCTVYSLVSRFHFAPSDFMVTVSDFSHTMTTGKTVPELRKSTTLLHACCRDGRSSPYACAAAIMMSSVLFSRESIATVCGAWSSVVPGVVSLPAEIFLAVNAYERGGFFIFCEFAGGLRNMERSIFLCVDAVPR